MTVAMLLLAPARADEPTPVLHAPIREVDFPDFVDAAGTPVSWSQVHELAVGTDALARVHRREVGRNLVRVMFVTATALEAWGTVELADRGLWTKYLLGAQTGFTGACAIVSFTTGIEGRREDRAILLNEVNANLGHRR